MNLVGIYMKMPDDKMEPDPNCPDHKDTGIIILFTSSSPCRCLKRGVNPDDTDIFNYNEGNWE